jgi:predicted Zn-dependent protease
MVGYLGYQVYTSKIPCVTPLSYSLQQYDARFGLSQALVEKDIDAAAAVWNQATGKEVFLKSDSSDLPIIFVYGELQSEIDQVDSINNHIDATKDELTKVANQYSALKKQYDAARRQGRATKEMYDELQALYAKYYELRAVIDKDIAAGRALPQEESEAGKYVFDGRSSRIYVFGFQSEKELESTLIHEFGHALGLEHVDDKNAVMYPTDTSLMTTLGQADLAEMHRACGEAENSTKGKMYALAAPIFEVLDPYITQLQARLAK